MPIDGSCPICLYPLTSASTVCIIHCGHTFHAECLTTWVDGSRTCPVCRKSVTPTSVVKLFFDAEPSPSRQPRLLSLDSADEASSSSNVFETTDSLQDQNVTIVNMLIRLQKDVDDAKTVMQSVMTKNVTINSLQDEVSARTDEVNRTRTTHLDEIAGLKEQHTTELTQIKLQLKNNQLELKRAHDTIERLKQGKPDRMKSFRRVVASSFRRLRPT